MAPRGPITQAPQMEPKHIERVSCSPVLDNIPRAQDLQALGAAARLGGEADVDEADGLLRAAAGRAGDAGR